ncbi:CP family cyanate transporter-like MFS transporter [Microbacterium resistens]|uniref:CP family cyanate transporter-like MFS transporter n=1 Tax=Microbacterium resistens TaxID=156977 RepID=A0ABU1SCQ6_9MICO|nr:MFS transporter [Microbacterium resistens]MDR6867391.1 CP family cyanate transporter-like MFS transporter [Microbacterium resistens]
MTTISELPDTGSTSIPRRDARRGAGFFSAYLALGLLLIAFNLRIGVASVGPVLSSIQSGLDISASMASLLTSIPVFAFGAFAFLTPALTRRIGLHRLLGVSMALVALGIGLRLIASPIALFGGTVLVGAAIAVANVCIPAAIKQDFGHRVGLMMGLYSTSLFIGAAVASGLTAPMISAFAWSWREALGFWLVPAVVALVVWTPHALRKPARGPAARIGPEGEGDAIIEPRDEPRFARLFRDPVAWAVTGFMGLQSLSYYAALTWIPSMLHDAGTTVQDAGLLLAYSSLPGIVAALTVPLAISRMRPHWLPVALSTALCAAALAGLIVAPWGGLPWIWMTALGLGQGAAISLSLTYIVLRSPDAQHTAHVSTMAQGIGYVVAGFGPLALGALHSLTDNWVIPIIALIAILIPQVMTGIAASRERHVLSRR